MCIIFCKIVQTFAILKFATGSTQNRKGRVIIMRRSIKKAMSLTLASAMTLSLAACGGSNTAKETTAAAADTTAAAESSAAGDAADRNQ